MRTDLSFRGLLYLFLFILSFWVQATHIRAGEITAERINKQTLTFRFTFIGYRDSGSNIQFGSGKFNFGDGNSIEADFQIDKFTVSDEVEMVRFSVTHTYDAANYYIVSYKEEFRNDGVVNMENSVNTAFYVESMISLDPFLGVNDSPVLSIPPIDHAAVGKVFTHNLGAYDPDGDSLSYELVTPRQGKLEEVLNYKLPNDPMFYDHYSRGNSSGTGPPVISIDPISGVLTWDAPGELLIQGDFSEYSLAVKVVEWRYSDNHSKWNQVGYVIRDMQIIVDDTDNDAPLIQLPESACVVAEEKLEAQVRAEDPNGDDIGFESYGELEEFTYYDDWKYFESPAEISFKVQTHWDQVRQRPYKLHFKATDDPQSGFGLVDFASMEISVVGKPPTGLKAEITEDQLVQLQWDAYQSSLSDSLQIWRRVDTFNISKCVVGVPVNAGYRLIKKLPVDGTAFLDDGGSDGFAPGASYSYRVVANYPEGKVSSIASEQAQVVFVADAPIITNVDVEVTDLENGEIGIRWVSPIIPDDTNVSYAFTLYRALNGEETFEVVATNIIETTYTDRGLNTLENVYQYYLLALNVSDLSETSSAKASALNLNVTQEIKNSSNSLILSWFADVPWSNVVQSSRYHYVYRNHVNANSSDFVLIDSVDVTNDGFYYVDNGRFNGVGLNSESEYCYYISSTGSYGNSMLPTKLINHSQISCASPAVLLSGINEMPNLMVFPNPNDGRFKVMTKGLGYIKIVSLEGKEILNLEVENDVLSLDLTKLVPKGVYLLTSYDVNLHPVRTSRIVIEK